MPCTNSCPHMLDIPIEDVLNINQRLCCQDCNCTGPNLWMCMHRDCLRIGCSEEFSDHNTMHNRDNPSHCVHMNLSTYRFWCYTCKGEVYMERQQEHRYDPTTPTDTDSKDVPSDKMRGDSDRSIYNGGGGGGCSSGNLQSNEILENGVPSIVYPTIPTATTLIAMAGGSGGAGDTSESSDAEDGSVVSRRPVGLVGLQNIGNTCYLNAALQALSNTVPLTKFFLDCQATVAIVSEGRKPGLSRTYQALMTEMWLKKNGGYVIPSGILYGIRNVHAMFRGYHQHDTQEFLRNLMDQLHEELKQPWTQHPNDANTTDLDTYSTVTTAPTADEPSSSSSQATAYDGPPTYDGESSEGEYETCDSGVSERSSLSDDLERIPPPPIAATGGGPSSGLPSSASSSATTTTKRRLSSPRSISPPNRRLRTRFQNAAVIENQPKTSSSMVTSNDGKNSGGRWQQTKYKSIISDIFDGKLLSTVQCLTCNRVSSRVETFQDLSLPIPSRDHLAVIHGRNSTATSTTAGASCPNGIANGNGSVMASTCTEAVLPADGGGWIAWILVWIKSWLYGPTITLHDCLAAFFSTDELKGDNMYSCERCNKLRNGIKYSKVLQLPEVLCIHLKRFRHELMFSSKISSTVSFPLRGLEMRSYLHADCVSRVTTYELYSVICHHGTAGGGHYTCYALNAGQWYEFDDQCVTRVGADTVQNCEAYVLFYRKTAAAANSGDAANAKLVELSREAAACETSGDVEIFHISKQWLSRFRTCAEPGPIDNRDFLCPHGYVAPERAKTLDQLAVAVPASVYAYLCGRYGGNAPTPTVVCAQCHAHHCRLELEMETLMRLNFAAQKRQLPATHLLSKTWYTGWLNYVQRKGVESPGPIDNGDASSLYAVSQRRLTHGDRDYAEVGEDIWNFFHSTYGGGPELRLPTMTANDSSDSNSECNAASDAPLITFKHQDDEEVEDRGFADDRSNRTTVAGAKTTTLAHRGGCHGEPMDMDVAAEEQEGEAATGGGEEDEKNRDDTMGMTDVLPGHPHHYGRTDLANGGCCVHHHGTPSSGASNTSLTDEEIQSEKSLSALNADSANANPNVRRFYKRRKRLDYK
ncbi:Peptidase [Oryctes borbonicus]|uniref:ubiquitinyl hydrolase 1 n=1 Tax=Oryctes borbonicus TaxID=1629725 RepID=A0A0T6AW92_9SCAR|nr:Peptidase [Oryctes borbonicus]